VVCAWGQSVDLDASAGGPLAGRGVCARFGRDLFFREARADSSEGDLAYQNALGSKRRSCFGEGSLGVIFGLDTHGF